MACKGDAKQTVKEAKEEQAAPGLPGPRARPGTHAHTARTPGDKWGPQEMQDPMVTQHRPAVCFPWPAGLAASGASTLAWECGLLPAHCEPGTVAKPPFPGELLAAPSQDLRFGSSLKMGTHSSFYPASHPVPPDLGSAHRPDTQTGFQVGTSRHSPCSGPLTPSSGLLGPPLFIHQ